MSKKKSYQKHTSELKEEVEYKQLYFIGNIEERKKVPNSFCNLLGTEGY